MTQQTKIGGVFINLFIIMFRPLWTSSDNVFEKSFLILIFIVTHFLHYEHDMTQSQFF